MTQKTSISNDETSANAKYAREGDGVGYSFPVSGVQNGITSVTLAMYAEGGTTDLVSTYWSTANCTVTGINTIVTGSTQNLKRGNYILSIKGTLDGLVQTIVTVPFIVKRRGER